MLSEFIIGIRTRWALVAGFDFLLDFSEFLRSHTTHKETAPDMSPGAAAKFTTTASPSDQDSSSSEAIEFEVSDFFLDLRSIVLH